MKVLVIGSGAREHALALTVARSENVTEIHVAPGNGGTATMGGKVRNLACKATDVDGLLAFALDESVDLTVVGPEQPLELGVVDRFREKGLRIIGPTRLAARLETSKAFAKEFMQRHNIPTSDYRVFTDSSSAAGWIGGLSDADFPKVVKASGLAAGKGVVVASTREEALQAILDMFEARIFGDAADEVVIESFLRGEEASVFVLTDGTDYRFFLPSQDHKRIGEGDTGKNTGGMGAYAPAPLVTPDVMRRVEERIVRPTLEGMRRDGCPYTGFLYIGLMIDGGEPSVVEYNARLGDPEAQAVLPLLESDLVAALEASLDGALPDIPFEMKPGAATTVVLASGGYPDSYETGKAVTVGPEFPVSGSVQLFHAGTTSDGGVLRTSGGRVLSVTAVAPTLRQSIDAAYGAVEHVGFDGAYYRRDIGAKAFS